MKIKLPKIKLPSAKGKGSNSLRKSISSKISLVFKNTWIKVGVISISVVILFFGFFYLRFIIVINLPDSESIESTARVVSKAENVVVGFGEKDSKKHVVKLSVNSNTVSESVNLSSDSSENLISKAISIADNVVNPQNKPKDPSFGFSFDSASKVNNEGVIESGFECLADNCSVDIKKTGDKYLNEEIIDGVDLEYEIIEDENRSGVKENIIIKDELDDIPNSFVFNLEKDEDVVLHRSLTNLPNNSNDSYYFADKNGGYLAHFESLFAIDSAGEKTTDIDFEVIEESIIITVDPDWLNSEDREFPIYIDPTIVHDTQSEFASGSFDRLEDLGSGDSSPSVEMYQQPISRNSDGLVGLWSMDNNWNDSSGNGNNGTANNGATFSTSAKLGSHAGSFDGTDDYVSLGSGTSLDDISKITIEAWIKLTGWGGGSYGRIYEKGTGTSAAKMLYVDGVGSENRLDFYQAFSGGYGHWVTPSNSLTLDTWYHVALKYDSSSLNNDAVMYINGIRQLVTEAVTPSGSATSDSVNNARIGNNDSAIRTFNGLIDEVAVYNRLLSDEEIKSHAQNRPSAEYVSPVIDLTNVNSWTDLAWTETGVATGDGETLFSTTGLIAQWNFNETSGTTANNDAEASSCGGTPSNCDGTLTNFASTGSQDAAIGSGWSGDNRRWGAGALMFDGSNDYLNIGTNSSLDVTSVSVEAWIKTSQSSAGTILSNYTSGKGYIFAIGFNDLNGSTPGLISFYSSGANAWRGSIKTVHDSKWHHVVVTNTSDSTKFYIDGILDSTESQVSPIVNTGGSKYIGQYSSTNYFDGIIDSVRVYSRALSADEILSNYNATNIQFQTRVGDTSIPDATWEDWKPSTGISQLLSLDSDAGNWELYGSNYSINDSSDIEVEGSGSVNFDSTALSDTKIFSSDYDLGDDDSYDNMNIIVNSGATLTIHGTHTFYDFENNGTVEITPYDGTSGTGELNIKANKIINTGTIDGSGRGYGGGGGAGAGTYEYHAGDGGNSYGGGGGGGAGGTSTGYSGYCPDGGTGGVATGGGSSAADSTGGCGPNSWPGTVGGAGDESVSGGTQAGTSSGGGGGGGGGSYGGAGGAGSNTGNGSNGSDGGYLSSASNGDSSTDFSVQIGSGGGGGGGSQRNNTNGTTGVSGSDGEGSNGGDFGDGGDGNVSPYGKGGGGGGGGGAGGSSIKLYADSEMSVSGTIKSNGGDGGAGGVTESKTGGTGGGGAGGGIALNSPSITLTGSTIQSKGNALDGSGSTTNGGTIKVFYDTLTGSLPSTSNAGRIYSTDSISQTFTLTGASVGGGLVYLPLDETNGDLTGDDVFDQTSNDYDGEVNGTTVVKGVKGNARNFDGTDDVISLGDVDELDNAGQFSVSMWFRRETDNNMATAHSVENVLIAQSSFAANDNFEIGTDGGKFDYYVDDSGGDVSGSTRELGIVNNRWYHLVTVYDNQSSNTADLKFYLDGELVEQIDFGNVLDSSATSPLSFGGARPSDGITGEFDGDIDEIFITTSAMSSEQIYQIYRSGADSILERTISSTDLSSDSLLELDVASDSVGTFSELSYGENGYAQRVPDSNTVGFWDFNDGYSMEFIDDFTTDTTSSYTWETTDTNTPTNSHSYDSTNDWVEIRTGDNDYEDLSKTIELPTRGYAKIVMVKRADYPSDNDQDFKIYQDANNYYDFGWCGSVYSNQGVAKYVNGSSVMSSLESGNVDTNNGTYTIETWWSPNRLRLDINGTNRKDVATSDSTEIVPKYFKIHNMQTDFDLSSIEIYAWDVNQDKSGNGNNAYVREGYREASPLGHAINLDGSSDFIDIGLDSNLQLEDSFTLSMWVKPDTLGTNDFLFGGSSSAKGFSLRIDDNSADNLEFYLGDGSSYHIFTYAHGMSTGNWYNVVASYNESTSAGKVYVNGVLIGSSTDSFSFSAIDTYGFKIGSDAAGANYFDGSIDHVEISNVARTATEIRQMYESGMRSHLLTSDFVSTLSAIDIKGTSESNALTDISFILSDDGMINNIFDSEKIIVKENYGGTDYVVQGEVVGVNSSTRTVTVSSLSGTVPNAGTTICGGSDTHCFTTKATVFKWQKEYIDLSGVLNDDIDGVTNISVKTFDGGWSIWLDDISSVDSYMTNSSGSTISSSADNQYFQYRAIYTTTDPKVSASLEDVTLDYESNNTPLNTSVTLTNPYEGDGNDVFPNGSSEYTFRAVVEDLDGYENLTTVTLNLADNNDNSAPYTDLQFVWTQASDSFNETGTDSDSAVTINSDSGDSSCAGNQCTLDFNLVFNDAFETKGVEYNTQLITVDDYSSSDTDTYTNTYQSHSGYVVQNATTFDVTLTEDWSTSVETVGQTTVVEVGLSDDESLPVAEFSADFSSGNLDWSGLSTDSDGSNNKAFMHYSGGFTSIPGAYGSDYSLYVPKGADDLFVGICPGVSSLSAVSSGCDDLVVYRESDTNVSVEDVSGSDFWVISGLTNTGGFSFSTFGGGLELRNVQSVRIAGTTYLVSATSGGVSVTNESDWTEYDSSYSSLVYKAVVSDTGDIYFLTSEKDLRAVYDVTSLSASFSSDHIYSGTADPAITGSSVDLNNIFVTTGTSTMSEGDNTLYVATDEGLVVIQEDQSDESNGSVKYYTKDYITEELIGDIIVAISSNGTKDSVISNSSTISDVSVNSHDGTTSDGSDNSMTYVSGVRGTGIDFDGEDDSISLGTSSDFDLSSYSIGGWFKTTASDNFGVITSKNASAVARNWWISIWSSASSDHVAGSLDFRTSVSGAYDLDLNSAKDLADGYWHQFIVVLNGSTSAQMYIDGILVDSDTPSGVVDQPSTAAIIGNGPETSGRFFDGSIDEFFITSEVLDASDAERLYSVGKLALESHGYNRVDGVEVDCGLQEIYGSTNIITSLSVDDNNDSVYLGTYNSGISVVGLQSDSLVKIYNTGINLKDDFNNPWSDNSIDALWFSGDMNNEAKESSLVAATDDGVWLESSDISLYSALNMASSSTMVKDEVYAGEINVHGDVLAGDSNKYNLGSSDLYWDAIYSDNLYGKNTSLQSFDLAENYISNDPEVSAGDVVVLANNAEFEEDLESGEVTLISKSEEIYDEFVIGVVSTKPAITLGEIKDAGDQKDLLRPVALAGRVPVKISTENGDIEKGDFLVAASDPGYAMKACGKNYCKAGYVLGMAMESFSSEDFGDSQSVIDILGESRIDNQQVIHDLQVDVESLENSGDTEISEQDMDIIEEISEELVEESDNSEVDSGKGRIMLYVDLMWYDPEYDTAIESRLFDMEQTLSGLMAGGWIEEGNQLSTPLNVRANSITSTIGNFGVLKIGELNIAQDRFLVDSLGNVSIAGDLAVSGAIQGRYGDLRLSLGDVEGNNKLVIQNSEGDELVSVDSTGKFSVRKIKVDGKETSAGIAEFMEDEQRLRIESDMIDENSKVFVSVDMDGSNSEILNGEIAVDEVRDGYFTVFMKNPSDIRVRFDWWVIN